MRKKLKLTGEMKMKKYAITALLTGFAISAQAALIVNFDSATQVTTATSISGSFDLAVVSPPLDYTGPELTSSLKNIPTLDGSLRISDTSGMGLRSDGDTTALHLLDTGGVNFDGQTTIANDTKTTKGNFSSASFRYVIQEDSTYYASAAYDLTTVNYSDTVNPTLLTWYSYNPTTFVNLDIFGAASTPTFTNVNSAGIVLSVLGSTANRNHGTSIFKVDVIPEPVTVSLLGLVSILSLITRRFLYLG